MVVGQGLIDKIVELIIDPIILLIFAAGLALFMWGLFEFIRNLEGDRDKGKQHMVWGLIGMFVMVAVQGIIGLAVDTFDIGVDQTPFGGGVQNARNAVDPFRPAGR